MTRETMVERSIKLVRNMRDYKRFISLRAAVDTRDVEKLIENKDERVINAILTMTGNGGSIRIVDTSPKKFIEKIIIAAAWDQRFYTVFGPPGIGKTITADYSVDQIKLKTADPIGVVRVSEFNKSNLRYFFRDIAHCIKIDKQGNNNGDNDMRWRGYITYSKLKETFSKRRGVIIIDEAHRLKENIFDGIRDLMDETQLSFVILGASEFSDRLDVQFLSRVGDRGDRYDIPAATPNDVRIFTEAYGIEIDSDESKVIAKRIRNRGSIRTLSAALKVISKMIREEDFSWRGVGGGQILDAITRVMTTMKVNEETNNASDNK